MAEFIHNIITNKYINNKPIAGQNNTNNQLGKLELSIDFFQKLDDLAITSPQGVQTCFSLISCKTFSLSFSTTVLQASL